MGRAVNIIKLIELKVTANKFHLTNDIRKKKKRIKRNQRKKTYKLYIFM